MKLKHRLLPAALALSMVAGIGASPVAAAESGLFPWVFGFGSSSDGDRGASAMVRDTGLEHKTYTDKDGTTIPYWIYVPKNEDGSVPENLPVVVYLHGHTDGGNNDIVLQLHSAIAYKLLQERDDPDKQAIILMPQTPENWTADHMDENSPDRWVNLPPVANSYSNYWWRTNWDMASRDRSANLNAAYSLIKETRTDYNTDLDRTYLYGMSMGGTATWDLILRDNEDIFAAAVPVCGIGDASLAHNALDLPIRTFHGTIDDTIPVAATRQMYDVMREGGNITYVEYPTERHLSWNSAWSPKLDDDGDGKNNLDDLIEWMFNQSKHGPLDGKTEKDPLKQLVSLANAADASTYSAKTIEELSAAAAQAQALLDQENPSKEECDKAARKISHLLDEKTGNLALNKPTNASYNWGGERKEAAVDGSTSSYWDGGHVDTNPQFTLDLMNPVSLDSLKIVTYVSTTRSYKYDVFGSLDGKEWTKIAAKTDTAVSSAEGKTFELNGDNLVRYIRVDGKENSANGYFHIAEIEAYGSHEAEFVQDSLDEIDAILANDELVSRLPNALVEELNAEAANPLGVDTTNEEIAARRGELEDLIKRVNEADIDVEVNTSMLEFLNTTISQAVLEAFQPGEKLDTLKTELENGKAVLDHPTNQSLINQAVEKLHRAFLDVRYIPDEVRLKNYIEGTSN